MAGTTTDIIMQFIAPGDKAIPAECRSIINADDALAFKPVDQFGPGFKAGHYFLVDSFRFGIKLAGEEHETQQNDAADKLKAGLDTLKPPSKGHGKDDAHADLLKMLGKRNSNAEFMKWRSAEDWKKQNPKTPPYAARINDFSFTRRMDVASTSLFFHCFRQTELPFASLIKRRSAPGATVGLPENQAYLRIDFADVQISSLSWSDDDVLEEKCSFRAKSMRVQYWRGSGTGLADADSGLRFANKADWTNPATVKQ